jgi:hypothetical protein
MRRLGDLPMTPAERQARRREREQRERAELLVALLRIEAAPSIEAARALAAEALRLAR